MEHAADFETETDEIELWFQPNSQQVNSDGSKTLCIFVTADLSIGGY